MIDISLKLSILFSDQIQKLISLKSENPLLKVLISVTGPPERFSEIGSSADMRAFADACAKIVRNQGVDGIDVLWEYPSRTEKSEFSYLLQVRESLFNFLVYKSYDPISKTLKKSTTPLFSSARRSFYITDRSVVCVVVGVG